MSVADWWLTFPHTATLYGDVGDDEERLKFLDKVFEMGCTFWDTAEVCNGYAVVVSCRVVRAKKKGVGRARRVG